MSTSNTLDNSEFSSRYQVNKPLDELIESIKLERKKYNEYLIIKDVALMSITEDSTLLPEVHTKIHNLFMIAELELTSNATLLGLAPVSIPDFTYQEKSQIRSAVQSGIIKKRNKLFQELNELGIMHNDLHSYKEEDEVLINLKKELNEKQQSYVLKLEELIAVLEQIVKLKSETFPNLANEKINMYDIKIKLYNLQSELLNAKLKVKVFMETDCSLLAYEKLIQDILHQQTECKMEIRELEELKKQYEQVSCEQFREILQKFLKYKNIINQKTFLHNKVQENNA